MKSQNEILLKGRLGATQAGALSQAIPDASSQFIDRLSQAVSRLFTTPRPRVIVVGCDARATLLATELRAAGKQVSLIKPATGLSLQSKAPPGVKVIHSTKLGPVALERAGAKQAHCLVVITGDDVLNLNLCREAQGRFRVPVVIAQETLPEGVTKWARLNKAGVVRMTWGETVRGILGETEPSPCLSHLASVTDHEQIVDLEMHSPVFAGRKIADLPLDDSEVLALTRNGNHVPDCGTVELRMGDVLTLVGTEAELKSVRESLTTL